MLSGARAKGSLPLQKSNSGQSDENPASEWLSDKAWQEIGKLSQLDAFEGLLDHFRENLNDWMKFTDNNEIDAKLPGDWEENLRYSHKLTIANEIVNNITILAPLTAWS